MNRSLAIGINSDRAFWIALGAALFLHAMLLLIPTGPQRVIPSHPSKPINVSLTQWVPGSAPLGSPSPERLPDPIENPSPKSIDPPLQKADPGENEVKTTPDPEPASVNVTYLLSRQFDYRTATEPFAKPQPESIEEADFYFRERTTLADVLPKPSIQLPFEDTRIYLVDSYGPGLSGSLDRFFDNATLPFGFTTKSGTRVQCAWILVVAGCAWGPAELFYNGQKARRRHAD